MTKSIVVLLGVLIVGLVVSFGIIGVTSDRSGQRYADLEAKCIAEHGQWEGSYNSCKFYAESP